MGTGCWWVSGLLLGALFCCFTIILRIAVTVKRWRQRTNLAWLAGGYRSVGFDWWVSGLVGASFYHHQHHPPPTTNISLLNDVHQRTNLAWRVNTTVQINAYNTTQHLFHCNAVRVSAKTMHGLQQWVGVCTGCGGGCNNTSNWW